MESRPSHSRSDSQQHRHFPELHQLAAMKKPLGRSWRKRSSPRCFRMPDRTPRNQNSPGRPQPGGRLMAACCKNSASGKRPQSNLCLSSKPPSLTSVSAPTQAGASRFFRSHRIQNRSRPHRLYIFEARHSRRYRLRGGFTPLSRPAPNHWRSNRPLRRYWAPTALNEHPNPPPCRFTMQGSLTISITAS